MRETPTAVRLVVTVAKGHRRLRPTVACGRKEHVRLGRGSIAYRRPMRVTAQVAGVALLSFGVGGLLYAMYITGPESVLGDGWKAVVWALAAAAIAATAGGLTVASRGIAERSWILYGLAALLHILWYAVSGIVAENL